MTEPSLTWTLIDQIASELGASEPARRKWRQEGRGVPSFWRIRITEALMARGAPVALNQFDQLTSNPGRIAA